MILNQVERMIDYINMRYLFFRSSFHIELRASYRGTIIDSKSFVSKHYRSAKIRELAFEDFMKNWSTCIAPPFKNSDVHFVADLLENHKLDTIRLFPKWDEDLSIRLDVAGDVHCLKSRRRSENYPGNKWVSITRRHAKTESRIQTYVHSSELFKESISPTLHTFMSAESLWAAEWWSEKSEYGELYKVVKKPLRK